MGTANDALVATCNCVRLHVVEDAFLYMHHSIYIHIIVILLQTSWVGITGTAACKSSMTSDVYLPHTSNVNGSKTRRSAAVLPPTCRHYYHNSAAFQYSAHVIKRTFVTP